MKEKFDVRKPSSDNIIIAFKNLIFYINASIQLEIYKDYQAEFKKVFDKINNILKIYINKEKLSLINENELQNIKFSLIDLDTATKTLNSYYAEWALLWIEAIISLRISEIGDIDNGKLR